MSFNNKTIHLYIKKFECKLCKKRFFRNAALKSHLRVHVAERPYRCKFCNKTYVRKSACMRHENIHFGIMKVKHCKQDSMSTSYCQENISKIKNVFIPSTKDDDVMLEIVDKNEGNKFINNELDFKNRIISNQASNQKNLKDILEVGNVNNDLFQCDYCDKEFYQKLFIAHVQIHQNNITCNLCDKKFDNDNELNFHMKIHNLQSDVDSINFVNNFLNPHFQQSVVNNNFEKSENESFEVLEDQYVSDNINEETSKDHQNENTKEMKRAIKVISDSNANRNLAKTLDTLNSNATENEVEEEVNDIIESNEVEIIDVTDESSDKPSNSDFFIVKEIKNEEKKKTLPTTFSISSTIRTKLGNLLKDFCESNILKNLNNSSN